MSSDNILIQFLKDHKKPGSPMPGEVIKHIENALIYASPTQIENFIQWLFDGKQDPDPKALERLYTGNLTYKDLF